tara:strand:- start:8488 stop:8886 length:399 start_codon:yes stop_codon:yes gene_type:complete
MAKGLILRTNGKVEPFESNGLEDLQEGVGGDIEVCTSDENWTLWGNSMGRYEGLPMNQVAREFVAEVAGCRIERVLSLHGDHVLMGCDEEGGDCDLPEDIGIVATGKALFSEPVTVFVTQDKDGTTNRDVFL